MDGGDDYRRSRLNKGCRITGERERNINLDFIKYVNFLQKFHGICRSERFGKLSQYHFVQFVQYERIANSLFLKQGFKD